MNMREKAARMQYALRQLRDEANTPAKRDAATRALQGIEGDDETAAKLFDILREA